MICSGLDSFSFKKYVFISKKQPNLVCISHAHWAGVYQHTVANLKNILRS